MGQSLETIIGPKPAHDSYEIIAWRQAALDWFVALLDGSIAKRSTVYYVDATGGSDSNDGLSTGAAFQTLAKVHAVLAASSGDVAFLFKCGETWTEAAGVTWEAGDGGHDAAIYCTKDGVTFGTYGTGAGPIFKQSVSLTNNNDSCFRLEGDDIIVDLRARTDGSDHGKGIGWGYDTVDSNPHDYFVSTGVSGTDRITVANLIVEDSNDSHGIANWWLGASGTSGGYVGFLNITGGNPTSGVLTRLINLFQPGGGMEAYCYSVVPDDGSIVAVNGHTGGTGHAMLWLDSCVGAGAYSTNVATGDGVAWGCRFGSPSDRLTGDNVAMSTVDHINTTAALETGSAAGGLNIGSKDAAWFNDIVDLRYTGTADDWVGAGIYDNSIAASSVNADIRHALIRPSNNSGGSKRGVGLSYDAMQNNDQATDATAELSLFVGWMNSGSISGSYPVAPGIGDSDTNQINNAYFGMQETTSRNQAGYSNVTTAVALTADPVLIAGDHYQLTVSDEMDFAGAPVVEFDLFGRRRPSDSCSRGPIERNPVDSVGSLIAELNRQAGSDTRRLWTPCLTRGVDLWCYDAALQSHGISQNGARIVNGSKSLTGLPTARVARFNGVDQRFDCGDGGGLIPAINAAGGVVANVVFRPNTLTGNYTSFGVNDGSVYLVLQMLNDKLTLSLSDDGGSSIGSAEVAVPAVGVWHLAQLHLASGLTGHGVINGNANSGSVLGLWSAPTTDPTEHILLGARGGSTPDQHFDGDIALLEIRAGSATEADAAKLWAAADFRGRRRGRLPAMRHLPLAGVVG